MTIQLGIGIKIANYKCFGPVPQGFDTIKPFNIIVGKNNAGKTALIDLLDSAAGGLEKGREFVDRHRSELHFSDVWTDDRINRCFPSNQRRPFVTGGENLHDGIGRHLNGKPLLYCVTRESVGDHSRLVTEWGRNELIAAAGNRFDMTGLNHHISEFVRQNLKSCHFVRIRAERDVREEKPTEKPKVGERGEGVTSLIEYVLHHKDGVECQVEETLLQDLNEVFGEGSRFNRISAQRLDESGNYEIYLHEEEKQRVPLSSSGSGLKTVLTVLCGILLEPLRANRSLNGCVFAFEELENSLHPAILRRLLAYLHKKAVKERAIVFLTTHSNVALDAYSRDDSTQIIHVTHDGKSATCKTEKTYFACRTILDDLDVRASDLLQANGLVWVEGPSDRTYINSWIRLRDSELQEGLHYQIVFYGGKLLAHLDARVPGTTKEAVEILTTNRNAWVVMDRDRVKPNGDLAPMKEKIRQASETGTIQAWITHGKEIENYIHESAVGKWFDSQGWSTKGVRQVGPDEPFFTYVQEISNLAAPNWETQKPRQAATLAPYMERDALDVLDLESLVSELCKSIRNWNRMQQETT